MTTTLSVRQYKPTKPVDLRPGQLESLLTTHRTSIDVLPTPGTGFLLRGNRWVGVIRLPDLDVLVRPKVSELSVFWMLSRTGRAVALARPDVNLAAEAGVLDALAHVFASEVYALVHRGLYREYVEREEQLPFIRGRLLVSETITSGRGLAHRPVSRFTELTADTAVNQALRMATEMLLRFSYQMPGLPERLRWNLLHLAEATPRAFTAREVRSIATNRLNEHYRPALSLSALALEHMTFEFAGGSVVAPAFLVNMDAVYQQYLTGLLAAAGTHFGLRLRRPGALFLDEARQVEVDPDIVLIGANGQVAAAFDAKYKLDNAEADIYQALAYAKALGLTRVTLVYPDEGDVAPSAIRVRHDAVEILIRTVPVGRKGEDFQNLDRRAGDVARQLIAESLDYVAANVAA